METKYGGLMEFATCKWSVYVRYEVHDELTLEQKVGGGNMIFGRLADNLLRPV